MGLDHGFSNGALGPLRAKERFSGGHEQRPSLGSFAEAEAVAVANKITAVANTETNENLLKVKLVIFVEEQRPQVLRVFTRGSRIMKV